MNKLLDNKIDFNNFSSEDLNHFKKIYEKNLVKFNSLIDKVSSYNKITPEWNTQTILSRNNYLSNIYFEYCKLEILKKRLKKNTLNKIYIKNNLQKKIISENFKSKFRIEFFFTFKKNEIDNFFVKFKNLLLNFKFSIILFLNRSSKRKEDIIKSKKFLLIENFLYQESYKKKIYEDRYYGKFLDYLNTDQKKKTFFLFQNTNISKLSKNLEIIKKYDLNFIIISDFLFITDYLSAIIKSQKNLWTFSKKITYNNLDLSFLFQSLYENSHNDINSFHGILQFLFLKRLKAEISDKNIFKVIDWYENQALDKGFNLGLKKFFPAVETVGYQPLAVDFNFYSHLIPTKKELLHDLAPKKIAWMGRQTKKYLTKKFKLNKKRFILCPSLRYEELFKKLKRKRNRKIKKILIALPISYQDSEDIINTFSKFIKKYEFKNFQFFINYHPMLNFEKLMKKNTDLNKKYVLFKGSFSQKYYNFDCIISNTSSICLESIALATPVIIIENSKSITQNPISIVKKDIWRLVKNEKELEKSLTDLIYKKNKKFYYKNSKIIRDEYFSKLSHKNIINFLGLK